MRRVREHDDPGVRDERPHLLDLRELDDLVVIPTTGSERRDQT